MGAGMARVCHREGHDVVAWNRTRERAEPLAADGIAVADSVAEAVDGADAVVTMLFDEQAVLSVCPDVVGALGADAVWIQSATVGPAGQRRIAEAAGRDILDAPMLGTKKPAEQGSLVVLVSGAAELVKRAQPVFDAVGTKTVGVGDEVGAASALKLACNAWIASITAATAQSLALAEQLGVDPHLFLAAIEGGPVDTPYAHLKGGAMMQRDWTPSFGVDGLRKDLTLMIEAAAGAGVATELLETVRAQFDRVAADGHADDDIAAVRTAF